MVRERAAFGAASLPASIEGHLKKLFVAVSLMLAGLSAGALWLALRPNYVPAAEVTLSIESRLATLSAGERVPPSTTPEGDALLKRALRGAAVFDDAIDGVLADELQSGLSKRFDMDEWQTLTPTERSLIVNHPPVAAALSAWEAGSAFDGGGPGSYGSLHLCFQLVWLGEDAAAASGSELELAEGMVEALQVVAELFATQDDFAWTEGARLLASLEPRLRAHLGSFEPSSLEQLSALAELVKKRLPSGKAFLTQSEISTLEEGLGLATATGPDAPMLVNNLYESTQALEASVLKLTAVVNLPRESPEDAQARMDELARLSEEFDELPIGASVLSAISLEAVREADACHGTVAAILDLLDG